MDSVPRVFPLPATTEISVEHPAASSTPKDALLSIATSTSFLHGCRSQTPPTAVHLLPINPTNVCAPSPPSLSATESAESSHEAASTSCHVLGQLQLHRILQPRDLFPPIPRSVIFHQRRPKLVSFYRSRLLVLLTVKPPVQQTFVHPSPSVFFSSNSSSARGLIVSLAHANRPRSSPRFEPAIPVASRPSKPKRKSSPSPSAQEASEAQRNLHINPSEDKPRNFPQSSFEAHVQLCFSPV